LKAAEAVVRLRSVRKAAEELHVSPGAVTQQIRGLERDLGIALIWRKGNGIGIHQALDLAAPDLSAAFRLLANAASKMKAFSGPSLLRVSVDPAFAAGWLIVRLPRFRALHAEIEIMLVATNRIVDLERGEADVAIRFCTGVTRPLSCHRLFADEVYPVCSPHLARRLKLRDPAALKRATLLHLDWSSRFGIWPDWSAWHGAAGVAGIDADRGPRFTDHALMLQAAIDGQGVALGTPALVNDHISANRLVAPFSRRVSTEFGYFVVFEEERSDEPALSSFSKWLVHEASQSSSSRD
jgi:LysR family glycine cleavage system transcriptional activator